MRLFTILLALCQKVGAIADYVVGEYTFEGSSADWHIQKWQSGKMTVESLGLLTQNLDYTNPLGSMYAATYTLTLASSMVSTVPFIVDCNTMENSGATFWGTTTAQNGQDKIELMFVRPMQGSNVRTQHSIKLTGAWK